MPEAGRGLSLRLTSHQRAVTAEDGERIEYLFQPSRRHRTRVILSYDGRQDKPVVTVPYRYAGPQMLSDEFVLQRCDEIILQKRECVRWMRAQTHAVLDAAYCIAGGSGYILYRGRKTAVAVDATAKTSYVDVRRRRHSSGAAADMLEEGGRQGVASPFQGAGQNGAGRPDGGLSRQCAPLARVVESLKREDEMGMLYDEEYDQTLLEADLP